MRSNTQVPILSFFVNKAGALLFYICDTSISVNISSNLYLFPLLMVFFLLMHSNFPVIFKNKARALSNFNMIKNYLSAQTYKFNQKFVQTQFVPLDVQRLTYNVYNCTAVNISKQFFFYSIKGKYVRFNRRIKENTQYLFLFKWRGHVIVKEVEFRKKPDWACFNKTILTVVIVF